MPEIPSLLEAMQRAFAERAPLELARDVLDVAIVAYLIYRLLLMVRGTRAIQMGAGLLFVFLAYLAARALQLATLLSLLSYVLSSLILIVVVVFQNDIRRALIRVGGQAWLGRRQRREQTRVIDEVVAAVTELARHRIGAIIAFEQDANLLEFTRSEGTTIDAAVTRELLVAIFYPESVNKLHDGAVVVRDLKIERAGVLFPMPEQKSLDASYGTRHRAALGITEETDAVVVVVSEERGTISFCFDGNLVPNIDGPALRQALVSLLDPKSAVPSTEASPTSAPSPTSTKTASLPPPRIPAGHATSSPLPVPRPPGVPSIALTTPLPKQAIPGRIERAKAEAARSLEEPTPHAKRVTKPMPRNDRAIAIPVRRSTLPNSHAGDPSVPLSERVSFVTAASELHGDPAPDSTTSRDRSLTPAPPDASPASEVER
jgi:diadenylate cyclase